jgi:UDP-glucose 4-epimerase
MKVIIVGIAGELGQLVAARLAALGHEVVGIDRRPYPGAPKGLLVHQVDIRKRAAEDVFRRFRPDAVVHMATVSLFAAPNEERHRINLGGTRAVFQHCRSYGAEHCIFVGRHTYYGAAPDAPLYHSEDEPPSGLSHFPELTTTVMRVCYTLGKTGRGTLAQFLRGPIVPTLLGFDPLFQLLHEGDVVSAVCAALERRPRGVFNVTGPQPVPLSVLIRETGRRRIAVPELVLNALLGRFGLPRLPKGAVDHIKYAIVMDGSAFRAATGFAHEVDEVATMAEFRAAFPAGA